MKIFDFNGYVYYIDQSMMLSQAVVLMSLRDVKLAPGIYSII